MYTRCPKCSTCFRVTDRHLAIANGKVRCGQCQHVFNARQNAIDEPQQVTAATRPPVAPQNTTEITTVTPTTTAGSNENILAANKESASPSVTATSTPQEAIELKQQESLDKQIETEKPAEAAEEFNANATTVEDLRAVKTEDINEIDLDAPAEAEEDIFIAEKDDDEIFVERFGAELDDNEDLNAAIEEITQANNLAAGKTTVVSEEEIKPDFSETRSEDIFSTDDYETNSASSVEDILNEMEGQLSLDIDMPGTGEKETIEDEFDFFVDEEETSEEQVAAPTGEEKSIEEQFMDDIGITVNATEAGEVDPDELFDEIDLSDFDDDVTNAVTEDDLSSADDSQFEHSENNAVPFQLRNDLEQLQRPVRRKLHPLLSFFVILLLLGVSFAQLAYFRSYEVVKFVPASRPLLEIFCTKVHCVYSGPRDIKQIKLLNRDVRQHPKEKNALLITATMINKANFAQPYPDIHIRLSDISGNVVAERIFNAKTYMGKLSNPFLLMKSKTPVHLNFEVVDPGKDAVNFEFTFQ